MIVPVGFMRDTLYLLKGKKSSFDWIILNPEMETENNNFALDLMAYFSDNTTADDDKLMVNA